MDKETDNSFSGKHLLPVGVGCLVLGVIFSSTIIGLPIGIFLLIISFILTPIGLIARIIS